MEADFLLGADLRPGTYLCCRTGSPFGYLIRLFTRSRVDHAFVYLGGGQIAEARITGVRVDSLSLYAGAYAMACTDDMTAAQREKVCAAARSFAGREYGWRDIGVLALRHLGAKWKWLLRVADDRDALICSELVCLAGLAASPPMLWQCGEPAPEYVTPADLASRSGTATVVIT